MAAMDSSCTMITHICEDSTFFLVGKLNLSYVFVFPTMASFWISWKSYCDERPRSVISVGVAHLQTQALSS